MSINRKFFFDTVRTNNGKLTQNQVDGFNFILDAWEASGLTDLRWLAYMLATTWHETNKSMQPVREGYYLADKGWTQARIEEWRKRNLRYYPYYGRGYVQLTWDYNYKKFGFENDPDKALVPFYAARVLTKGMTDGIFTGKKLSNYFNAKTEDSYNARRIINGLDQARKISGYYRIFKSALNTEV